MNDVAISSLSLAEEMVALNADALSPDDLAQLQNLLLDYAAVALCGSMQPWGQKLTCWASRHGAHGDVRLIGSGQTAGAATAGLVNGTSAHGYEVDDTHELSLTHPGAVVISAALAVATEQGSSGREALSAMAAGYEVMTRLGLAAHSRDLVDRGFHVTCLYGTFAAATAAAKLMGLDANAMARAWGLALSMTGGASQFAFEPEGTMVKRMHGGIPAHNGIVAAQLASLGMTAPVRAFEGEFGFLHLYGADTDPERLFKAKGTPLEIHQMSLKPYACCRKFHSLIDALEQATGGFSLSLDNIAAIEVHTPQNSITKHQMRRPESVMAAQYSMPYIAGATLAYGPNRFDAYEEAYHRDAKILRVIDKVTAHRDENLEQQAPGRMSARVVLRLESGDVREAKVIEALGSPARPLDRQRILAKARALLAMVAPSVDIDAIAAAVDGLTDADTVTLLTEKLVVPGYRINS